jgi:hypothetical protein
VAAGRLCFRRRYGEVSRFLLVVLLPVVATFVVAGIWHGAGWTFVVFGLVHGVALAVNHAWREARLPAPPRPVAWALTMLVVVGALVFFRADRVSTALSILGAMAFTSSAQPALLLAPVVLPWIAGLAVIALAGPNTQELMGAFRMTSDPVAGSAPARWSWRPGLGWALATGGILAAAALSVTGASDFLYYQF